jgi:hypothetical protein
MRLVLLVAVVVARKGEVTGERGERRPRRADRSCPTPSTHAATLLIYATHTVT